MSLSATAESAVAGAANGGELRIEFKKILEDSGTDQLISATNLAPRISAVNAPLGGGFTAFNVTATAPPGTERVIFVLRVQGANGNVLFDQINAEVK